MPLRMALWQFGQHSNVQYLKLRFGQVMWCWRIGSVKQNSWYRDPDSLTACVSGWFSSDCLSCDPMDWMSVSGWSVLCVPLECIFQFSFIWKKRTLCAPRPCHEGNHLQKHTPDPYQNASTNGICLHSSLFPFLLFSLCQYPWLQSAMSRKNKTTIKYLTSYRSFNL